MSYESALAELEKLAHDVDHDRLLSEESTESDTRARVIDRILRDVLEWPEAAIHREEHSESGYSDYTLRCPHPVLVVEAKRVGVHFVFPREKTRRTYSLESLRSAKDGVGDAVRQVREYADERGIEFACVTNGVQWLVFRAITPGEPWTKGTATVYRGLDDLAANFTDFWNLLSYEAIAAQSLRATFATAIQPRLTFSRALDDVLYSDAPLQRNALSVQLQPLITALFRDLIGAEQEEVLRKCYVVDRMVQGVSKEVRDLFDDTLPAFAKRAGFKHVRGSIAATGALYTDFKAAVDRGQYGTTVLLLGGIGSGKTTFIHRFFRITARDFVDKHCLWLYVPFTEAPPSDSSFSDFLRDRILRQLKADPSLDITSAEALECIYQDELDERQRGLWSRMPATERLTRAVNFIETQLASSKHCDAVLRYIRKSGKAVAVVIDNVDQRTPEEQEKVFFLAHEVSTLFDAIVVVALREESFFKAEQAGAFNAYHNIRYHIASPDVRTLLRHRIEYALKVASGGPEKLQVALKTGVQLRADEIRTFMQILHESALKKNPLITQFIDAVSQNNMRIALDMFNQFMVSGATDVHKMLESVGRSGYVVPEHEFMKAVMLGDFLFYKEKRSRVLNVFEASGLPAASNLTSLRVLEFLARRAGHTHPEGIGFVALDTLFQAFEELFGDRSDVEFHLPRLTKARLVEFDNRQVDELLGARFARITASGLYYLKQLSRKFQYLDLVCLDTPIWDKRVISELRNRSTAKDLYERIARVEWFMVYLKREEDRSTCTVGQALLEKTIGTSVVQGIEQRYRADRDRVVRSARLDERRIQEIEDSIARVVQSEAPAFM